MRTATTFDPEDGIPFDFEKLCDVIHFAASAVPPDRLGRVKLHKILYFADMLNFLRTGEPLTGEDYIKQRFGPTARHLNKALGTLAERGQVETRVRDFHGLDKYDFTALKPPGTNRLSSAERALLEDVIAFVCSHTANEISDLSHNDAWDMAQMGERIPYYMAFSIAPGEITEEDQEWARGVARKLRIIA